MANFDHIHIHATNPEHTLAFYREHFGAERAGALKTGEGTLQLIILGGQFLAIAPFPSGVAPAEPTTEGSTGTRAACGIAHFGLQVQDIESVVGQLEQAGVTVHGPVRGSGALRYVYLDAPDGVCIELTQYVLPRRLVPGILLLRAFDRAVHVTRRTIARQLTTRL